MTQICSKEFIRLKETWKEVVKINNDREVVIIRGKERLKNTLQLRM